MFEIELLADVAELPRLDAFVQEIADEALLSTESRFRLAVVLEELFVNVARHGAGLDGRPSVRTTVVPDDGELAVTVTDTGVPFDLTSRPDPDLAAPVDVRQPGGLGIHFIRQFVRELHWQREGNSNVVRFLIGQRRPVTS